MSCEMDLFKHTPDMIFATFSNGHTGCQIEALTRSLLEVTLEQLSALVAVRFQKTIWIVCGNRSTKENALHSFANFWMLGQVETMISTATAAQRIPIGAQAPPGFNQHGAARKAWPRPILLRRKLSTLRGAFGVTGHGEV